MLEQWDAEILLEALNAVEDIPDLYREIRRHEDLLRKEGRELAGRQALRLVWNWFLTNETEKEVKLRYSKVL